MSRGAGQCPKDHALRDIFSIKISKNGGLLCGLELVLPRDNKQVMMNSMIEPGITQMLLFTSVPFTESALAWARLHVDLEDE